MTLLEQLQFHAGGLVKIKTRLFWHGGRGWDGTPDRICLILDAASTPDPTAAAAIDARLVERGPAAAALLLIDGAPHWVWVAQEDVEIL